MQIKFNILFDYENQQQKKITKYCNKSLIADINYNDFFDNLQVMYKRSKFFFDNWYNITGK